MFILFATKANLPTDLKGFRFNFLGKYGKYVKRTRKSRGYKVEQGKCMTMVHLGKRTVYIERKSNKITNRRFRHFAG